MDRVLARLCKRESVAGILYGWYRTTWAIAESAFVFGSMCLEGGEERDRERKRESGVSRRLADVCTIPKTKTRKWRHPPAASMDKDIDQR